MIAFNRYLNKNMDAYLTEEMKMSVQKDENTTLQEEKRKQYLRRLLKVFSKGL